MMKTILLIGNNPVEKLVAKRLQDQFKLIEITSGDLTEEKAYADLPKDLTIMVSFVGPMDADLAMESFFAAVRQQSIKLDQVVMISTSGIDNEVDSAILYDADYIKDVATNIFGEDLMIRQRHPEIDINDFDVVYKNHQYY